MTFFQTIHKLIVRYSSFFHRRHCQHAHHRRLCRRSVRRGVRHPDGPYAADVPHPGPLRWIAVAYIEFIRGTPLMSPAHVHFLRSAYDRHYHSDSLDSQLLAFCRRHCRHEHEQLRLCSGERSSVPHSGRGLVIRWSARSVVFGQRRVLSCALRVCRRLSSQYSPPPSANEFVTVIKESFLSFPSSALRT